MSRKKPKKTTQAPSKYTPLARLKQIQRDHYVGANGVDYDAELVDRLIMHKETIQAEKASKKLVDQWDEYEEFLRAEQNNRSKLQ